MTINNSTTKIAIAGTEPLGFHVADRLLPGGRAAGVFLDVKADDGQDERHAGQSRDRKTGRQKKAAAAQAIRGSVHRARLGRYSPHGQWRDPAHVIVSSERQRYQLATLR